MKLFAVKRKTCSRGLETDSNVLSKRMSAKDIYFIFTFNRPSIYIYLILTIYINFELERS